MAPRPEKIQPASQPSQVSNDAMLLSHLQAQLEETQISFDTVNELLGRRTTEVYEATVAKRKAEKAQKRAENDLAFANEQIGRLEERLLEFQPANVDGAAAFDAAAVTDQANLPPAP